MRTKNYTATSEWQPSWLLPRPAPLLSSSLSSSVPPLGPSSPAGNGSLALVCYTFIRHQSKTIYTTLSYRPQSIGWGGQGILLFHAQRRAVRDCICLPRRIWCGSEVCIRIRTLDPDYFQNLMGTSLSKDTQVIRFSWKSDHSLQRYKPNSGKCLSLIHIWRCRRRG